MTYHPGMGFENEGDKGRKTTPNFRRQISIHPSTATMTTRRAAHSKNAVHRRRKSRLLLLYRIVLILSFCCFVTLLSSFLHGAILHTTQHEAWLRPEKPRNTRIVPRTISIIDPITTSTVTTTIPQRLIFTHQKNILETQEPILFYQNIQRTVALYQQAWNQTTTLDVWFLDDEACRQVIQETEPRLVDHFAREGRGAFKSDICRIAALYQRGGYYLDCDLYALEPVDLAREVTFATVLNMDRDAFFQAFTAAVPGDAILRRALTIMADYYEESWTSYQNVTQGQPSSSSSTPLDMTHFHSAMREYHIIHLPLGLLGPSTLKAAHDEVFLGVNKAPNSAAVSFVLNTYTGQIRLLREAHLFMYGRLYPHLSRQNGDGILCNFMVHDPSIPRAYFFSRFPGASEDCHVIEDAHTHSLRPRSPLSLPPTVSQL